MNQTVDSLDLIIEQHADLVFLRTLTNYSFGLYFHALYVIGLPQLIFNLSAVILILKYGHWKDRDSFSKTQSVLIFIVNLAMADVASFGVMATNMVINKRIYAGKYFNENPMDFWMKQSGGCRIIGALWCFTYVNSLCSTIFITVERYILVSKTYTYSKFINKKTVVGALAFTWIVPAINALLQVSYHEDSTIMCVISHSNMEKQIFAGTVAITMVATLTILHVLDIKILFTFWRLKRRLSLQRSRGRSSQSIMTLMQTALVFPGADFQSLFKTERNQPILVSVTSSSRTFSTTSTESPTEWMSRRSDRRRSSAVEYLSKFKENLNKIRNLIKAAKYIIALLIARTLCWLPWIILFFGDIIYHGTGLYDHKLKEMCGTDDIDTNLSMLDQVQLQLCLHGLMAFQQEPEVEHIRNCQPLSGDEFNPCVDINRQVHSFTMRKVVEVAVFIASTNSLINPLIYALCSSEFRSIVKHAWRDFKSCF